MLTSLQAWHHKHKLVILTAFACSVWDLCFSLQILYSLLFYFCKAAVALACWCQAKGKHTALWKRVHHQFSCWIVVQYSPLLFHPLCAVLCMGSFVKNEFHWCVCTIYIIFRTGDKKVWCTVTWYSVMICCMIICAMYLCIALINYYTPK